MERSPECTLYHKFLLSYNCTTILVSLQQVTIVYVFLMFDLAYLRMAHIL
jgi:hypothetical protein